MYKIILKFLSFIYLFLLALSMIMLDQILCTLRLTMAMGGLKVLSMLMIMIIHYQLSGREREDQKSSKQWPNSKTSMSSVCIDVFIDKACTLHVNYYNNAWYFWLLWSYSLLHWVQKNLFLKFSLYENCHK